MVGLINTLALEVTREGGMLLLAVTAEVDLGFTERAVVLAFSVD